LDPAHGRTESNLGLALGFCTLKDRRLFWVLYLGSCIGRTQGYLGPAPHGSAGQALRIADLASRIGRPQACGLQTLPRESADPRLKAGQTSCHVSAC